MMQAAGGLRASGRSAPRARLDDEGGEPRGAGPVRLPERAEAAVPVAVGELALVARGSVAHRRRLRRAERGLSASPEYARVSEKRHFSGAVFVAAPQRRRSGPSEWS